MKPRVYLSQPVAHLSTRFQYVVGGWRWCWWCCHRCRCRTATIVVQLETLDHERRPRLRDGQGVAWHGNRVSRVEEGGRERFLATKETVHDEDLTCLGFHLLLEDLAQDHVRQLLVGQVGCARGKLGREHTEPTGQVGIVEQPVQ